jgi:hypothetical protein
MAKTTCLMTTVIAGRNFHSMMTTMIILRDKKMPFIRTRATILPFMDNSPRGIRTLGTM